ncbi:hypothetical protein F4779DRAFT_626740 [Xylariaceae sp. FL0662B]|nr:hypothetical protein F4779DRAFT_626740 [Xylariaceae sp. FL0662B]
MSVQDLARSLVAAGSVKLPGNEEGIYLLDVRDGNLVEKFWVGDVLETESVVASGARDDTTASYLLGVEEDLRLIVFIDQENTVQCYAYNEEIEEWEETPLGSKWNITTSPESKLSANIGPKGEIVVSYQDEAGQLAGIMSVAEEEWRTFGPLDGSPVSGTPLCLDVIDEKIHLFYIEKYAGIGYLVHDPNTGNWQANLIQNAKFDTPVVNFSVVKDPETSSFQSYFITDGSLWSVDGDKGKICLGRVNDNGKLIPSDKAQAGWRVKWKGARKHFNHTAMAQDPQNFDDFDLEDFVLPTEFWHSTQRSDGLPKPENFGIDLSTPPRRWEDWVAKLSFEKLGSEKHGSGFYVNIPNAAFDVIVTAGHNLVDKPQHYCSNIRIVNATDEIPVTPDMIRVCQRYFDDPDELNAIYDYGIILLKRGRQERLRGFGFNLMLGLAPSSGEGTKSSEEEEKDMLQDRPLYVCGYEPNDKPSDRPPGRSEGQCIRPSRHQLQYKANTKPGMSGGPVWIGFRGVETVVGIHNYGAETESSGNRGSRLNLDVWRTIFGWLDVGWYGKSLHYRGSRIYSMHLHLPQDSASGDEGRVRVGKPGRVETLFDVLPVAAKPKFKESDAGFGFRLRSTVPTSGIAATVANMPSSGKWVRWDPRTNRVSLASRFDARCEVKLQHVIVQPGKPFVIQVQDGNAWKQVRMTMGCLDEADLEPLVDDPQSFEDTSEISFVPLTKEKLFEFK